MRATYKEFWGKAGGERPGEPGSHPLAYHSLDVAAVADVLLQRNRRRLGAMARLLGTSPDNARRLLVALIALHDVGKFSAAFQAKNKEAWPTNVLGDWKSLSGGRHDELGSVIRDILRLKDVVGLTFQTWSKPDFADIWHAVSGHHGQPRSASEEEISALWTEIKAVARERERVPHEHA